VIFKEGVPRRGPALPIIAIEAREIILALLPLRDRAGSGLRIALYRLEIGRASCRERV